MKKITERHYMTYDDRKKFARLYRRGATVNEIAAEFAINVSTVYRELARGTTGEEFNGRPEYSATKAQEMFFRSLGRRGRKRVGMRKEKT